MPSPGGGLSSRRGTSTPRADAGREDNAHISIFPNQGGARKIPQVSGSHARERRRPTRIISTPDLPQGIDALVSADASTVIVREDLSPFERRSAVREALAVIYRRVPGFLVGPWLAWRRLAEWIGTALPAAAGPAVALATVGTVTAAAAFPAARTPSVPPPQRIIRILPWCGTTGRGGITAELTARCWCTGRCR